MSLYQQTLFSEAENYYNSWNAATNASAPIPVSQRKQFLARKIHKLKKLLKLRSKAFSKREHLFLEERQNAENEQEQRQNRLNHELEKKFLDICEYNNYECEQQNAVNENWETWDGCYLCAGNTLPGKSEWKPKPSSMCYVFMPGQAEPVPVKLRTARIPGGVMWISYRPDLDICDNHYSTCSYTTTSQLAQAQRPIVV